MKRVMMTIMFCSMLLTSCRTSEPQNTLEPIDDETAIEIEIENENEEPEISDTTTIQINIAPQLLDFKGEMFDTEPIIDFSQYGMTLHAYRFWDIQQENGEIITYQDGIWNQPYSIVNEISDDKFNAYQDTKGELTYSYSSGDIRCFIAKNDKNQQYLLYRNHSGYDVAYLNDQEMEICTTYTGIPVTDICNSLKCTENEFMELVKNETILEDETIQKELLMIDTVLNDWDDFIDDIDDYIKKDTYLLSPEYVNQAKQDHSQQLETEKAQREEERLIQEKEMREAGAILLIGTNIVIETETEYSEVQLKELEKDGMVSEFGIQIKYLEDGTSEYTVGYTVTSYALEDGTKVKPIQNEENPWDVTFQTENGTTYKMININFNSEDNYEAIWVQEVPLKED